ncbi:MAG: hypothetical protein KGO02_13110, partial [Alphaproteobacteria bacterium]|nr:hypothetical protein [Alphaproteobacteria bacterium]
LEEGREGHKPLARVDDLPLFSIAPAPAPRTPPQDGESALKAMLEAVTPDTLTPRQALELIYELKAKLIAPS